MESRKGKTTLTRKTWYQIEYRDNGDSEWVEWAAPYETADPPEHFDTYETAASRFKDLKSWGTGMEWRICKITQTTLTEDASDVCL